MLGNRPAQGDDQVPAHRAGTVINVTDARPDSVGQLAELYLGNILFALERTAVVLDEEARHDDAAFYRGIARALAEARGQALRTAK